MSRRKHESGEATIVHDIAKVEKATDPFIIRTMRLPYLSPEVLLRLLVRREPPAISVAESIKPTYLPWRHKQYECYLLKRRRLARGRINNGGGINHDLHVRERLESLLHAPLMLVIQANKIGNARSRQALERGNHYH